MGGTAYFSLVTVIRLIWRFHLELAEDLSVVNRGGLLESIALVGTELMFLFSQA